MPEGQSMVTEFADDLITRPRAHLRLELRQDEDGLSLLLGDDLLAQCYLTREGMMAGGFLARSLGVKVPPLGESVTARVSTGVLYRALGICQLDFTEEALQEIARSALERHGVREEDVDVAWVPGAFELPLAARRLAESRRYDAVACLGAIIRGETPHFDYIAAETARGIGQVAQDTGVPTIFGVLTPNTLEQAMERAGGKVGDKGYDAAVTAIEMATLMQRLRPD